MERGVSAGTSKDKIQAIFFSLEMDRQSLISHRKDGTFRLQTK
jgi:hypothetical protein